MYQYTDELKSAAEQIARQKHLKSVGRNLVAQKEELSARVAELKAQKDREQADVDKLEGRTLTAFFASIIGKKDEKLQKERTEAYAAAARYESAVFELESIERSIDNVRKELRELDGCEKRYERIYAQRLSSVKRSNSPEAERIFEIEEQLSSIRVRKKEINEALTEGKRALDLANDALDHMNAARRWNRFDMYGGDGMFSHYEKHGHLDSAQSAVEYLQAQLSRFNAELADVQIHTDMNVKIDGFMRFADYFFDGIFVDIAIADRIEEGICRINNTKNEITRAVYKLEDMQKSAERREAAANDQIRSIVENSNVGK